MKVGELFGELTLKTDQFDKEIDKKKSLLGSIGGVAKTAMKVTGAAIIGAGVAGVTAFAGFDKQMREVFTLIPGISQKGMAKMTGQVKDFSTEFGVLPNEVVPALYQSLSAGVPKGNVFEFLETAQKAAKGGVTELTTAVDGISSVVNAYGSDVIDAAKASDLMFTAVKGGKTNFEELSSTLFNVIPTASSLGLEFGNVTAALASMTAQGTPTSVATTQMRQMLVELSKEGGKASATFKEIAGVGFKQFIAEGGNLQDALQLMEVEAKRTGVGVNDLFGSVEAGSAALTLTGKGTQKFTDELKAAKDSAGATDAAFKTMSGGLADAFDKIKAAGMVLVIGFGEMLAPAMQAFADFVIENFPKVQAAIQTAFEAIGPAFDALKVTIEGVVDVAASVISTLEPFSGVFVVIAGVITAVMIPALIQLAIQTAISIGQTITLWTMYKAEAIKASIVHAAQVVKQVATWALLGIQSTLHAAKVAAAWVIAMGPIGIVTAAVIALVALIIANWDTIKEVTVRVFSAVVKFLGEAWQGAKKMVADVVGQMLAWLTRAWATFLEFFFDIAGGILDAAATAFGWVPGVGDDIKRFRDDFKQVTNKIIEDIREQAGEFQAWGETTSKAMKAARAEWDKFKSAVEAGAVPKVAAFHFVPPALSGGKGGGGVGAGNLGGNLVSIGKSLQGQGFRVSGHPEFGGVTQGAHAEGSYHYIGRAIDINWGAGGTSAEEIAVLTGLGKKLVAVHGSNIKEILGPWNDANHKDHLHIAMAKGGWINEEIYGVGLRSGRSYSFGENGRERVTPEDEVGKGGIVIHMNADVYDAEAFGDRVSSVINERVRSF